MASYQKGYKDGRMQAIKDILQIVVAGNMYSEDISAEICPCCNKSECPVANAAEEGRVADERSLCRYPTAEAAINRFLETVDVEEYISRRLEEAREDSC